MAGDTLTERIDIHKSCKALETIVNVFNDYCQAAESLAVEQKKLSRALKDAAALKATNDLVGNALNAAATLLESLAEVDARFVKVADKECEGVSSELKKWFKKLAKEEKNHDERIAAANARIKQAGQTYEKKAKKKDRDAVEEHTRYVNLLSAIGPEMSQEKYNHALFVTQRHTSTIYSIASSISRTADAEWTRACECVRRFAPVIGRIGEYRAYLEGGWMGGLQENGPDGDIAEKAVSSAPAVLDEVVRGPESNGRVDEMGVRVAKAASGSTDHGHSVLHLSAPAYTSTTSIGSSTAPSSASSSHIPHNIPQAHSLNSSRPPPSSYSPATADKLNTDSVRSIESLSSFPSPPTHFPLPDMAQLPPTYPAQTNLTEQTRRNERENNEMVQEKLFSASSQPNAVTPSTRVLLSESPKQVHTPIEQSAPTFSTDNGIPDSLASQYEPLTPAASPDANAKHVEETDTIKIKSSTQADTHEQQREDSIPQATHETATRNRKTSGPIERSESVISTNSIVASMRDKWSRGDGLTSSPPRERDMPRVPHKVSELASRYKPAVDPIGTAPLSPRNTGQISPTADRARQVSGPNSSREDVPKSPITRSAQGVLPSSTPTTSEFDFARRRRRVEELEDLERREQAQALRAREREIEVRARELERERERLRTMGSASTSGPAKSAVSTSAAAAAVRSHSQHSYSMTNLVAPRVGSDVPARPVSQYGEPLALSISTSQSSSSSTSIPQPTPIPQPRSDHAPYCGCYTCSAAQYGAQPSPTQAQQLQTRPEKEKPKGWMRRLSMPVVGNAFSSSDSKKAYGLGAGVSSGRTGYGPAIEGPPHFAQDGTGGISNVRPRKLSFGRR